MATVTWYVAAIILLLAALAGITLEKAYFYLPERELSRRADKGDPIAKQLMSAVTYGDELRLLLVLVSWVLATASVVIWVRSAAPLAGAIGAFVMLALAFFWQIRSPLSARGALLAAWCAPWLVTILDWIHPVLAQPAKLFKKFHLHRSHTGLYEAADVADFLEQQQRQRDNRISVADLQRVRRLLQASQSMVGEHMTSQAHVLALSAADAISPVLIDELHRSGHSVFPVFDGKRTNLIGTLRLSDIADIGQHGTVGEASRRQLAYVNQADTLEAAVRAFYETHQRMLIVLNNHGAWVGVLTLNDILVHIFGKLEHQAFGHFDDPDAVANKAVAKKPTEVVK